MTLEEFKANGSIREHLPHAAPALDEFLTDHLIATCMAHKGGEQAAAESGAAKAIANIILLLRTSVNPPEHKERKPMKTLHRFASGEPKNGATTPTTK
jgi:hypothetical protein